MTNKFAIDRLEAAIDCILAAETLADAESNVAERFSARAYQLVSAAIYSLKGEEDPQAAEPVY
ncbi:hypothetical protein [Aerobium aerolatum]|uniref:Uncharacterized protein n=1 Tax=Aquamicrobium aerolatum DSM 21857 TaxID=1121003 RepID=A0A1I3JHM3_9HYPH|nr:hypothetical protein [Aquamicrobium aerolatum]SFI59666.1 hypothetical protein SAMN03080618_00858 [Aquamicrobium aerolatum DSM 21857]